MRHLIWSQRSLGCCSVGPGGMKRGRSSSQGSSLTTTTDPNNTSSSSSSSFCSQTLYRRRFAALKHISGGRLRLGQERIPRLGEL